jgi:hypothetical protein
MNQTRPHCANQMGKTHSKPLAARHGKGTAWARHAMCESAFTVPITVSERSKLFVCSRSLAKTAGSNPAGRKEICWKSCMLSGRGFCFGLITCPEEYYRMWAVWVWSWSLDKGCRAKKISCKYFIVTLLNDGTKTVLEDFYRMCTEWNQVH